MRAGVRGLAVGALLALGTLGCDAGPPATVPQAGPPRIACQGVPDSICNQAVDTIGALQGTIGQVVVRCSKLPCTLQSGEAEVLIVFADGRREMSNYGWSSSPADPVQIPLITPPTLPVEPICEGVPFRKCSELATGGPDGDTDGVGKITVHCSAVCTPTSGTGETTYEFVDGRPSVSSSWTYEGGG
jgi:hypothetical protein